MHVALFLRRNSLESCAPAAGRGARSDLAARAVPGCVGSLQAPFDFADGRDHVCCFRVTLYVCQPSGAAECLRLGGSAVWLRAVFALSFGREPCSRRGFRPGACADRILVSEDCPHCLSAAGGGSKSIFRTVDGSGTLCLWKDSLLQKGRSGRARYLSIFRADQSVFRQSAARRADASAPSAAPAGGSVWGGPRHTCRGSMLRRKRSAAHGLRLPKSARKGASRWKPARNAGGCRAGDAERDMHVAKKLPRLLFSLYNRWEIPYNKGCVHRELRDPARAGKTKGRSMAWAW